MTKKVYTVPIILFVVIQYCKHKIVKLCLTNVFLSDEASSDINYRHRQTFATDISVIFFKLV